MTPLMAASARANVEAMRLLIEKKADVNAKNAAGATALMAAAATGSPKPSACCWRRARTPTSGPSATKLRSPMPPRPAIEETVKLLLDRGAEVNVQDIRGYSPLLYAAGSDAMPSAVVKMLLAKGADGRPRETAKRARMLAAKRGDTEVARLLGVPRRAEAPRSRLPRLTAADGAVDCGRGQARAGAAREAEP